MFVSWDINDFGAHWEIDRKITKIGKLWVKVNKRIDCLIFHDFGISISSAPSKTTCTALYNILYFFPTK